MLFHEAATAKARLYVEQFHRKFRSPYSYNFWKTIKEDHIVLIDMIDRYDMRTFLEIGTWKGYTSLMVYLHPMIERVKCIDVHKGMSDQLQGVQYEHQLHSLMDRAEYGSFFKDTFIELVFADTITYPHETEQHDLIFIDANHDYLHVKNDTELAISMNPKMIVWHDYGGGNDDVVKFINELEANGSRIFHFFDSLCVAAIPSEIKLRKE